MAVGRITGNFDVQIMDAAGTAPLALGTLTFTTAGTSTPKNTYPTKADAIAGTNANANPVVLNSSGRPASGGSLIDIWLLTNEMYKVVIKTSAGTVVRTIDNYSGSYEPLNETSSTDLQFADNTGLQDANSNEVLDILKTTSAVNFVTLQNAATAGSPQFTFAGDDANVNGTIDCKGTGVLSLTAPVTITGAAIAQSTLAITGTTTAAAINASGAVTVGTTLGVSGTTTAAAITASGTVTCNGALAVGTTAMTVNAANAFWATQAVQETGTSTSAAVTPGVQHFHQSAAKGWVSANVSGGINTSYNVTSVADTGTGIATVNWATDLSSANQITVYTPFHSSVSVYGMGSTMSGAQSVLRCKGGGGTTDTDPEIHCAAVFGDL